MSPLHQSLLLLLLGSSIVVNAEIRPYHGLLEPISFFVHYTKGYIVAPGQVDLTKLQFSTSMDTAMMDSVVDIVLFHQPDDCSRQPEGCDWVALGVGSRDEDMDVNWCCNIRNGDGQVPDSCLGNDYGRLIIDSKLFQGDARSLAIPAGVHRGNRILKKKGNHTKHHSDPTTNKNLDHVSIDNPIITIPKTSGSYVMILANCNDGGRQVLIDGSFSIESHGGYLPGDLRGEFGYFGFLVGVYALLTGWYAWSMKQHAAASIPIQCYILSTIAMGLVETTFRFMDLLLWDVTGNRWYVVLYIGLIVGTSKQTLSRCLLVMVGLGWGVTKPRLGHQYYRVLVFSFIYFVITLATEFVAIVAVRNQYTFNSTKELEWLGAEAILGIVVFLLNVLWVIWILASMAKTMGELRRDEQHYKLQRYTSLRILLLAFCLFYILWMTLVRSQLLYSFLAQQRAWIVAVLLELNYLSLLGGVAWLWRPNPQARQLAYEMELTGDLELSEDVPSAAFDYEEEEATNKLPVTEGVAT